MAKPTSRFLCAECGAAFPKWQGRCDACGAWNTLSEETEAPRAPGKAGQTAGGRRVAFVPLQGETAPPPRIPTGIAELDRVLGGGFVPGSVVLVGGDPGIGKSTIMLQAAARVSEQRRTFYVSGEEAIEQVRLRALRLALQDAPHGLAAATSLCDIAASLEAEPDA
ncbi:MAG: ATPase domain-containing protein, partial [Acetobacteraceae bacterium]